MSAIDARLPSATRESLLGEIREYLPAFLGSASVERQGPVQAASQLLNLAPADLRRVLGVHALLSEPVRALVAALPGGMRRPMTSSNRPRVASRSVTSAIDWSATIRYRATSGTLGDIWVTRPANRIFDIPENRALAWCLMVIQERSAAVRPDVAEMWTGEIARAGEVVRRHRRAAWLEGIPAHWPGDDVYLRLQADRHGFYKLRVSAAAKLLRRLLINPNDADVAAALCERYFEPSRDWQVFEVAVLLRMCRQLDLLGKKTGSTGLLVGGRGPFASYVLPDGRRVRLWYQSWPSNAGPSELQNALAHYSINANGTRPDIVGEILDSGAAPQLIVLELKASTSASYLGAGLGQLLGYLRDRPTHTTREACGWLVAPPSSAFTSQPAEGRAIWAVDSDLVAREFCRAVTPNAAIKEAAATNPYAGMTGSTEPC
jgi:hypothetical protein